ncbi:MAG: hypothetical protein JRM73_02110 [Nitrososphaerota archaeon]|nr:hypothetical protein [Nitrososphaerota archaeon]
MSNLNILGLYESGLSLREMQLRTGIPRETLRLGLHAMNVRMRHSHPIYREPLAEMCESVGLLLGLHTGDGWLGEAWGISLHSSDHDMIARTVEVTKEVLGLEPAVLNKKENTTVVCSAKSQAIEFFLRYGLPKGPKSRTVGIPLAILTANLEVKRSYLKGLFSADGCFHHSGRVGQCRFEVASARLRDGFVILARQLGFEFRSYSYVHHGGHNRAPLHTAYLGGRENVLRWMMEIGSICDSHQARFETWVKLLENI